MTYTTLTFLRSNDEALALGSSALDDCTGGGVGGSFSLLLVVLRSSMICWENSMAI